MIHYNRGSQIAAQLANNAVTPAVQGVNLADAIAAYKGGADWTQQYQDNQRAYNQKLALQGLTEDYGEAVKSGDTGLQNAILAQLDPAGYQRNQLLDRQMRQEQENWQRNFDANNVYKNAMLELQRQKAGQNGMTDKIRNYEYFAEKFGPERAALLVSPGSEAVGSALVNNSFGSGGIKKVQESLGKNYAEDLEQLRNMEANLPELYNLVDNLKKLSSQATFTKYGQFVDLVNKEAYGKSTPGSVARASYTSMIDNQVLPLLRETFGAAFTEKEGESLKATMGNPNMTPEEKNVVLDNFINQKIASINSKKRKLQSYNSVNEAQTDYKSKYGLE